MKGGKDRRTEKGIDPFLGEITRRTDSIQQQKGANLRNWGNGYGKFFSFFGARFGNGRESTEIGRTLLRNPTN